MYANVQLDELPEDQSLINSFISWNWWNTMWGSRSMIATCSLLLLLFVIASFIVLSLIPLYLPRKELNAVSINGNSASFDLIYATNLTDGSSLTITDLKTLSEDVSKNLHVQSIIVNNATFIARSTKIHRLERMNGGDWLVLSLTIRKTHGCISPECMKDFIATALNNIYSVYENITLQLKLTNGETRHIQPKLHSYEQPVIVYPWEAHSPFRNETTSQSTVTMIQPISQSIITRCQPDTSPDTVNRIRRSQPQQGAKKMKMQPAPSIIGDRVLLKNAYLVEFPVDAKVKNHYQTVTNSLKASHDIHESAVKLRHTIQSSLFSGVSFSIAVEHSTDALEMIEEAIAIYPIYSVPAPKPIKSRILPGTLTSNSDDFINSHNLADVTRVHNEFHNYGKGVRVAIIDTGIYYLHPALGGCFGPGCKVEFGYDFVGDEYKSMDSIAMPDDDPLDNCSVYSHGTHIAGIIAANTTGIDETVFISPVPFIGVAPQVTLGAYRILGCSGNTASDIIAAAIYRAYNDKADIINLSVVSNDPYPETPDAIAVQRVIDTGVYVTVSMGNDGEGGLQTGGAPSNAAGAMAVVSIDNTHIVSFVIIAPDGQKIPYQTGAPFGGWRSFVNSTIVVHDLNATVNDGCSGLSQPVSEAVVLFLFNDKDSCTAVSRCDKAARVGAIGCLFYDTENALGASNIPSGSISLRDGLNIIATVIEDPSAVYTFTNLIGTFPLETAGTPSSFTSFGLSSDLWFKPQISGIGGIVYSTVSLRAAHLQNSSKAYINLSGTSMASPYVAGTLALFLASIGNPAANTIDGYADNGICRPQFSLVTSLFQSTAMPVRIHNSSLFATTAQQGAGLVNVYQALTATTIFSPSQLALNDTVRKAASYKVNLWNIGDRMGVYIISHGGAALATGKASDDDQLLNTPFYSADYADVDIEPTKLVLHPGESREITLKFQEPASADPTLLPIYSGFIYARNTMNGQVVHLSYAGVAGNYADARIIVRNTPSNFTTGVYTTDNQSVSDDQLLTLNATDGFNITVVTAWSTRLLFAEVISAQDDSLPDSDSSYGLVYADDKDQTFYYTNQPRNTAAYSVESSSQYNVLTWNGGICPISLGANCSYSQSDIIPPGEYQIQFAALKHFGNATDPADFEVYRTPSFNLVY